MQVYFMERKINSSTNGSLIKSSHTATRMDFLGFYMLKARECTAFSAPSTKQETNKTSRIKVDMLNTLMLISINGPDLYSPECNELIESTVLLWNNKKNRRKLPPKVPVEIESTVFVVVPHSVDSACQTEA